MHTVVPIRIFHVCMHISISCICATLCCWILVKMKKNSFVFALFILKPSRRSGTSGLIYIYGDSRDDFCTHQTFFGGLSHLPTVSRLTSLSFETY